MTKTDDNKLKTTRRTIIERKKTRKALTAKKAAAAILDALERGEQEKANELAESYCGAVDPYFGSRSYVNRSGRLWTLGIEVYGADWRRRKKV
jgi:hypothetical protein